MTHDREGDGGPGEDDGLCDVECEFGDDDDEDDGLPDVMIVKIMKMTGYLT